MIRFVKMSKCINFLVSLTCFLLVNMFFLFFTLKKKFQKNKKINIECCMMATSTSIQCFSLVVFDFLVRIDWTMMAILYSFVVVVQIEYCMMASRIQCFSFC